MADPKSVAAITAVVLSSRKETEFENGIEFLNIGGPTKVGVVIGIAIWAVRQERSLGTS